MPYSRFLIVLLCALLQGCDSVESEVAATPPLIVAAEQGDVVAVGELLSIDPDPDPDQRDACQWTPLMKAALFGHEQVVEQLLAKGASSDLKDKGGYTALMLAASNNHPRIVQQLAMAGAEINQVESTNGWTALIWAAKRGHQQTVTTLLQMGANPQLKDHQGMSAKAWAEQEGFGEIARLLP